MNLSVAAHYLLPRERRPRARIPQISFPTTYRQNLTYFTSPPDSRQPHLKIVRVDHVPHEPERKQLTSCKQQGQQHEEHLKGLCSVITSRPRLSIIRRVKGRDGPRQFLVQQSVSSAAKYTLCPSVFLISYLLFVSKPVKTEKQEQSC